MNEFEILIQPSDITLEEAERRLFLALSLVLDNNDIYYTKEENKRNLKDNQSI